MKGVNTEAIKEISEGMGSMFWWLVGPLLGLLVLAYLWRNWKAIWNEACPHIFTKHGPVICIVWLCLIVGAFGVIGGGYAGARFFLYGPPKAEAQNKK